MAGTKGVGASRPEGHTRHQKGIDPKDCRKKPRRSEGHVRLGGEVVRQCFSLRTALASFVS